MIGDATGWDLSCPDWYSRLRAGRSPIRDLPLNMAAAERAVRVFDKLRLADVPDQPTLGEAGGEWFRDIVRVIFGSWDPVLRARMIRELLLLVPKKNSKTTNGALLMTTALLLNERPHASFILTAPVQDTAQLAFNAAAGAIALDPVLEKKMHVREHLKTIVHRETKAELEIMTFDPAVLTGKKASGGALVDEVHVVSRMAKAASAVRQIRGGMLPFPEAFLIFITTQSEDAPAGVFRAELLKAREIRDGKRRGAMLPVLYEFSEDDQKRPDVWQDPANWPLVTPNAGKSITIPRLIEEFRTARDTSEAELRAWASQHLNVEIGLALHANQWRGAAYWEQRQIPLTLDQLIERCEVITLGIDGGGLDDLLALYVIGRERETGKWLGWGHAWVHASVLDLRKEDAPRFLDFARDGDLTIVDTLGSDIDDLADMVAQIDATGLLDKIGVDQHGIGAIVQEIERRGVDLQMTAAGVSQRIVGVSQGWRLVGAIKTAERKLAAGEMDVAAQPLAAWCASNAKVEPRGNAIIITKQAAGVAKVDVTLAMFDAVDIMSRNPEALGAAIDQFIAKPIMVHR